MINGIFDSIQKRIGEDIICCQQVNTGYINDVFLIFTKNTRYYMKIFRISNKQKILHSISIQKYLAIRKIAPRIIVEDIGNIPYIVQESFSSKIEERNWVKYGELLGKIHYYLKSYHDTEFSVFSFDKPADVHDLHESQLYQDLFEVKTALKKIVHTPCVDRQQVIHGDYTWNNVVADNLDYKAIDYDEAKFYYPIYDISKVIIDTFSSNHFEYAVDFLQGYQSVCSIPNDEKKEMINVYAYTLMNDFSGLDPQANKNIHFYQKRLSKHKDLIFHLEDYNRLKDRLF